MNSRGERTAGGLTLEELIVAVNAAIEFHRPVVFPPQPVTKTKEEDEVSHYSEDHRQFSHHRHRAEHLTEPESVLEMFQNMLEKKEKHFYDLRAMNAAAGDTMISQPKVVALRNATIDQQQQTVAYVRDQATETEENLHHPALDVSAAADFHLPIFCESKQTDPTN
ncbi:hypothetical protein P3T76_003310 [Phytophthora citrophthora]|uniref:Uncharacterized protein n=1 Tax=Phytophthora citrophthora TaxID=4793 RepID=A0AAD9GU27_9STRA|nr:hypothetical protein P3T76_003310 [Phytophthora citrophthora]